MKATCIDWDKEGLDVDLPDEVEIPDELINNNGKINSEEIDDYLSKKTGFCHFGYVLEN